ncbi:MAG: hypothetical protein ABSD30_20935 [Candidatus Binatus sp.]
MTDFKAPLELFSLEEEAALLPGSLFVFAFHVSTFAGGEEIEGRHDASAEYGTRAGFCAYPLLNVICGNRRIHRRTFRPPQSFAAKRLTGLHRFNAVGGLVLIVVGNTLFPHLHEMGAPAEVPTSFLSAIVSTLGIIVLAKAACGFIAGWGLLHREGWGRVVALVLAFISLFNIPFGTAIGVYTMWVLLPAASQQEYDALSEERAA